LQNRKYVYGHYKNHVVSVTIFKGVIIIL
jgi:hypothetical protein